VLQTSPTDFESASWTAAAWLRTPLEILSDRSIIDALADGDVASAVEAATTVWGRC
jgi:hypothetical protein